MLVLLVLCCFSSRSSWTETSSFLNCFSLFQTIQVVFEFFNLFEIVFVTIELSGLA